MESGEALVDRPENESHDDENPRHEPRPGASKGVSLTPQIRDRIALQLRSMYDSVASQPVPDRFAELIARLDASEHDQG
ncbi:NepR family anti-sigma factor [Methylobacterium sp. J-076]|uniref:NepR family anti-sigma factor n=1 Tax=Methylobacterium sp. J-076 TaxID=2836655 RepID=UPI001FB89125|nr:NepR family anti-sigma factor [Methylobacterium sp. J-076]MCJ2014664.1 anti-sigma factor [Methylobacterium sp. J-076]